jgi:hypothetical protein
LKARGELAHSFDDGLFIAVGDSGWNNFNTFKAFSFQQHLDRIDGLVWMLAWANYDFPDSDKFILENQRNLEIRNKP